MHACTHMHRHTSSCQLTTVIEPGIGCKLCQSLSGPLSESIVCSGCFPPETGNWFSAKEINKCKSWPHGCRIVQMAINAGWLPSVIMCPRRGWGGDGRQNFEYGL